jgi:hypothetical protein
MQRLNIFRAKNDITYRYKLTVFIICVFISAFIWMLIKLSRSYSSDIVIPVTYTEIPKGKILVNDVDTTIKIGITDQGFSLAWLKYFKKPEPLKINLKNYRLRQHMHQYVGLVNTDAWAQQFSNQYALSGKLDYIQPDTIAFYFEDRYSLEVPVEPDIDIKFRKQYFAYDSMVISPAKVMLSGLYNNINNIQSVKTAPVSFTNLDENLDKKIALKKPGLTPDIAIEPEEVNVKLSVEKFTESSIEIPISMINEPERHRVKIFPDKATITFLVALKDYNKVSPDLFTCKVDLTDIEFLGSNKLEVSISKFPQHLKLVSIHPSEVDYLLLKR